MNDWNKQKLGFGLMRLPRKDGKIDIEAVAALADAFIANGFTYFDAAYVYNGAEEAFREAVVKRHPRTDYTIASKLAAWVLTPEYTPEDMFQETLRRLGVDYLDYYLLHGLQPSRMAALDQYDCWGFVQQKKAEGKVKHFGFSFHGDPEMLEGILNAHPEVDFVQIQVNYADWNDNVIYAGGNYEVCVKHGVDIIVMEPNKGGTLSNIRPELEAKMKAMDPEATPTAYALRFAASLPQVKMVLSGMNTMDQVNENMATLKELKPVTEAEKAMLQEVSDALHSAKTVPCTGCRYCVDGCPQGILIPDIFKAYNLALNFGVSGRASFFYHELVSQSHVHASDCLACGQCEAACPQHLPIIKELANASGVFDRK